MAVQPASAKRIAWQLKCSGYCGKGLLWPTVCRTPQQRAHMRVLDTFSAPHARSGSQLAVCARVCLQSGAERTQLLSAVLSGHAGAPAPALCTLQHSVYDCDGLAGRRARWGRKSARLARCERDGQRMAGSGLL